MGEKDVLISAKLKSIGADISAKELSRIWRKPFYCGIVINKLIPDPVKGNWEPMITEEEFFAVQDILSGRKTGYKVEKDSPFRPLISTLYCFKCEEKMTGYEVKKKKLHYYKCQKCKGVTINAQTSLKAKGVGANDLFKNLLFQYQLDSSLTDLYKEQVYYTYQTINKDKIKEKELLSSELEKLNIDLKNLKRNHAIGGLEKDLYDEFKQELDSKIKTVNDRSSKLDSKISSLDNYINLSIDVVKNISKYWAFDNLTAKQRIQEVIFPEGLVIDTKNRVYLTKKVNSLFKLSRSLSMNETIENKKTSEIFSEVSSSVARSGLLKSARNFSKYLIFNASMFFL
jgi:site-specific DNA recombinase